MRNNPSMGKKLQITAKTFCVALNKRGFNTFNSTTQIIPVITGDSSTATDMAGHLLEEGIKAPAIKPPTVPQGTARVRFSVHVDFTDEEMSVVLRALQK
ncbi:MAG: aminotransferase class I/II-fold pyridoxal phosphate-dependent enzyme [Chitinivibrionales bacterium]|nr:aminotransferase class I/II-fold pyridoxal phosphate-dependent enzyme [Chitinivibrionales bacterium]